MVQNISKGVLLFALSVISVSCDKKELVSMDRYKKDYETELNEFAYYDELEEFDSITCQRAIDSAMSTLDKKQFSLYAIGVSVDSSVTAIHILQKRFGAKILGFSDGELLFRFCFNKAILNEYQKRFNIDPISGTLEIYDSLENLGLTHKPPSYGSGLKDLSDYFYCKLEFPFGLEIDKPFPEVGVSFEIDPSGKVINPIIDKGYGPEYDSAALKAVREMNKWNPTRNETGSYESYLLTLNVKFDPEMTKKYCQ